VQHLVKLSDTGITDVNVVLSDEMLYLIGSSSTDAASLITPDLVQVTLDLLLSNVSINPPA